MRPVGYGGVAVLLGDDDGDAGLLEDDDGLGVGFFLST
jgi:hypothetical protein